MPNPHSPQDPRFGLAPNPLYYMYELKSMGRQERHMRTEFLKTFFYRKEEDEHSQNPLHAMPRSWPRPEEI